MHDTRPAQPSAMPTSMAVVMPGPLDDFGDDVGFVVGFSDGRYDGAGLGGIDGFGAGAPVGSNDGAGVGGKDGDGDGGRNGVGFIVGGKDGAAVGALEGHPVGPADGSGDGAGDAVGAGDGRAGYSSSASSAKSESWPFPVVATNAKLAVPVGTWTTSSNHVRPKFPVFVQSSSVVYSADDAQAWFSEKQPFASSVKVPRSAPYNKYENATARPHDGGQRKPRPSPIDGGNAGDSRRKTLLGYALSGSWFDRNVPELSQRTKAQASPTAASSAPVSRPPALLDFVRLQHRGKPPSQT
mmetsp:Transcript_8165/g.25534  ORF Transcript_8165/g.25534 Transcript_8165/m.25534 type:complete len:297 (+) Transcript_8165:716-1606(+)